MKKIIIYLIKLYFKIVEKILLIHYLVLRFCQSKFINFININLITSFGNDFKKEITHTTGNKQIKLSFFTPNNICMLRANTFSTKEPETLLWIEEFGKDGGILFDIGANIGLYSIFHSLLNKSKSYAFEPSLFNLS